MLWVMRISGAPLITSHTPRGIINLEFAYNFPTANQVLLAWKNEQLLDVAISNTYYDFIFIICYSFFFMLSCRLLSKRFTGWLQQTGYLLSTGALVAGGLDMIENTGMLFSLHGHLSANIALATACCASLKFLLLIAALLYLVGAGLAALLVKKKSAKA